MKMLAMGILALSGISGAHTPSSSQRDLVVQTIRIPPVFDEVFLPEETTVIVSIQVDEAGRVVAASLVEPHRLLQSEPKLLEIARQWRFAPRNDEVTNGTITFRFVPRVPRLETLFSLRAPTTLELFFPKPASFDDVHSGVEVGPPEIPPEALAAFEDAESQITKEPPQDKERQKKKKKRPEGMY